MKILKFFKKGQKEESKRGLDFYQESIEKIGRDQIKKLVDRGLSFPILVI